MLTTRQIELLKYLEKREEYTTTKELAEEFSISSRTIRNDLDAIEYSTKDLPIKIDILSGNRTDTIKIWC